MQYPNVSSIKTCQVPASVATWDRHQEKITAGNVALLVAQYVNSLCNQETS